MTEILIDVAKTDQSNQILKGFITGARKTAGKVIRRIKGKANAILCAKEVLLTIQKKYSKEEHTKERRPQYSSSK